MSFRTLRSLRPALWYALQARSSPHAKSYSCLPQSQEKSVLSCCSQTIIPTRVFSSAVSERKCWKCKHSTGDEIFCFHCKALQRFSADYNFFHLLGVEQTFNVDASEVSRKSRKLQSILHPDKFSNASDEEREISADMSSLVNTAYRTLMNPLERGLYMLQLHGTEIPEGNTASDNAFLMQVMELNEELESLDESTSIEKFEARIEAEYKTLSGKVAEAFHAENISGAKETLSKMKYINTILAKVKEKKQILGIVS